MTREPDDELIRLLREAVRPIDAVDPAGDLWMRVRSRTTPVLPRSNTFDWIVLAVVTALCVLRPGAVSLLLFHF